MKYRKDWQDEYGDMIFTPARALANLRSGQRVFIGTGCGEPTVLVQAMTDMAGRLSDVEIVQILTKGDAPYTDKRYEGCFRVNSFFIGHNIREHIQEGEGRYTPIHLFDIPRLFDSGRLPLDVALIQVTPPDERGLVSLGISVDVVKSAVENASLVIAQVNPQMPWTCGDSLIDIYDIDILVPVNQPLIERTINPVHETSKKIAKYVASLVPNGATLEFGLGRVPGVGRIPQAVADNLHDKHDLGIHTEMLTDSVAELVKKGVVNGSRKTLDKGKVVVSFCMGTEKLYRYIDKNPVFSFRPTSYVNDPSVISRQRKMISINMALEIDLTGQICSDSEAGHFYSGIGGQVNFNRGAAESKGGKAIITIPSTADNGKRSRIVTFLSKGSGVVIPRGAAHYIVTEFGVAYLHGKSIQERALALISIAHPDFREQLIKEAIEAKYLSDDFAEVEEHFIFLPQDITSVTHVLKDGTQVTFRSILPTDEDNMKDLLYALSQETVYYRFMSRNLHFTHQQIKNYVYIDHRKDVAIVGTVPEAHGDEIIAVGRYFLDDKTNMAEVAFVIRDEWQNRGLGKFMFNHLVKIARDNGIAGFTAEVLPENRRMQAIFTHSDLKVKTFYEDGIISFKMEF
jgi:acyl-CoA hydrolase/GNAT superfamily N-acetyltransferase